MNISYLMDRVRLLAMVVFLYVILPVKNTFAVDPPGQGGGSTPGQSGATPPASGGGEAVLLENPLSGTIDSLPKLVHELLNIVLIIGTPIVALAIIFAGFMLVAAQGNPEKLQKARQALLWAIVGGAVLLGSYVLARAIGGTVDQLTS